MDTEGQAPRRGPSRGLLAVLVWAVAIAWSVYLVMADLGDDGGVFAVIVQVMGSIGILYALFLVTRPKNGRVLGSPWDFRGELVLEGDQKREYSSSAARWAIITITLALAIGGLIYRLTQDNLLHQSAAFFIGVPAVLAITLALTPKAKSATGMIVKGLTLALLLSGVVFFEGFVCILMAAPLFYLVGIAVGFPIDRARRKRQSETRIYSIVGIGLLLLSVEGVTPATSFSQQEVVSVTKTVGASVRDVRATLATTPTFDAPLPFYLKLGFPRPVAAHGRGLELGDRRTIVFGKESPMEPMGESHRHDHHGHHNVPAGVGRILELEVVRSTDGLVVFKPVDDRTAFTHWISWGRSVVRWRAVDSDSTEVTWTLHFKRRLSPSWYFGPWQRYAAEKAAGYLIDTVVTP